MGLGTTGGSPRLVAPRYGDDLALTTAASEGSTSARRELAGRLLHRVRRTAAYLAGPNVDADDLAQVALIKILASAGTFRGECTLEYWADRIAVRTAAKQLHKHRRRERLRSSHYEPPPQVAGTDDEVTVLRMRRRLADQLQRLSPERRTAVVLHHVEGYAVAEIAEMTGAPLNTVRDRLRKGRKQLKKRILTDPQLKSWAEGMG